MTAIKYDALIEQIAQYVTQKMEPPPIARTCLIDALGCAALALNFPACTKLLGPVVPGTHVPKGSPVIGTEYELDPIRAAFDNSILIRWLDYNDTWLGAEWAHPSDNLGGILAVAVWKELALVHVLEALTKAYEIQGILALENSFNQVGFDHVILVKVATAAVVTQLLGGNQERISAALSHAFADVGPLRTYRHAPNTEARKSWAAGDATSRGVQIALWVMQGEAGIPTVLTAPRWGLYDVLFKGRPFTLQRPLASYVVDNILFKVSYPAEFHAQTAVEAAIQLYPQVKDRDIAKIEIETHAAALKIIDKTGPLRNPADRDHCLQYMTAIGLLYGDLTAAHYETATASDPRIDVLREKMVLKENPRFSADYHDPNKRSIANRVTLFLSSGEIIGPITVEYPIGHRRRRAEAQPLLAEKFKKNVATRVDPERADKIYNHLQEMPLDTPVQEVFKEMNGK